MLADDAGLDCVLNALSELITGKTCCKIYSFFQDTENLCISRVFAQHLQIQAHIYNISKDLPPIATGPFLQARRCNGQHAGGADAQPSRGRGSELALHGTDSGNTIMMVIF